MKGQLSARICFIFALTLAAPLLFSGCAVNPVTNEREFSLMSETQEIEAGRKAYPLYTQKSGGRYLDDELQSYVSEVGKKIAAKSHRPGLTYSFNVVNDDNINAYALPGGKISITRGLLARLDNESQLAAVLAHEIGHVTARHGAAGYTRQVLAGVLSTAGIAAMEAADISGREFIAQGGLVGMQLVLTNYSRDQERQADSLGTEYMVAAGYDPRGMVEVMEVLDSAKKGSPSRIEQMFSSHPLTSERLDAAKRRTDSYPDRFKTTERLGYGHFEEKTGKLKEDTPAFDKVADGKRLMTEGKELEGLKLIREGAKSAPNHAVLFAALASAELKAGDDKLAAEAASKSVELDPGLFQARYAAGLAEFKLSEYEESIKELDAAEEIVPGQPAVAFFIGRNHEEEGQREAAAKAYAEVLTKVKKGEMAEYSYNRLKEWGYLKEEPVKK